jgi:integrase
LGYAEKRGTYWRGRYKIETGRYGTVSNDRGQTVRYATKRAAQKAADDEEAKVRAGTWRDPVAARITFGEYANRWYEAQDLAASTMQTYRNHIEGHLLPAFEDTPIADILATDITAWEKCELAAGYEPTSVRGWRAVLHVILADAVADGIRESNPASKRRGRGKKASRSTSRAPEKTVTDALGILMVAERAALLSGRDDEFVAIVLMGYTGMRWGEVVGLETQYLRGNRLRVEWQLYELDTGELHRCPPKDDSHRSIDVPDWLAGLLRDHIARTQPQPCACHGRRYVFRGHGAANGAARQQGAKLVDVARRAEVSTGTVSNVLNHPETVAEATRAKVVVAIEELGYIRGAAPRELAAHWRRTGFATWLFQHATSGWYPKRSPSDAHPVPLLADPFPGIPVRGRYASRRAEACWLPIAPGLTPHGLRHTHKTMMDELGTPAQLMDGRLGHDDGSVQARYSHVTSVMRGRLMGRLTERWEASLATRGSLKSGSPVGVLRASMRSDTGHAQPATDDVASRHRM